MADVNVKCMSQRNAANPHILKDGKIVVLHLFHFISFQNTLGFSVQKLILTREMVCAFDLHID